MKVWLRESVISTLCGKARRTSQDRYGNNTNIEYAEFLLHRENSVSSPRRMEIERGVARR